ncbi:MAG: D-aminoacyl-tRNA deacylase [Thermoplasmata archaeon]|nr:D-aminoacyl-tRNA deacylase [Thermoplasmata archaeon]
MTAVRYVVVAPEEDPVGRGVADVWGVPEALGTVVGGGTIRRLGRDAAFLRHPGWGIEIEGLAERLPPEIGAARPTLVFASIHRSEVGPTSFTVHPIGNPGSSAPLGGRPGTLVPTDPRLMAAALRQMGDRAPTLGIAATYEATHHGPHSPLPAFFAELGGSVGFDRPEPTAVGALASILANLDPDPADHVAIGIGGGHYAPHFTDLVRRRRWAFGHLLSKHSLSALDERVAQQALECTPGLDGVLAARAVDRPSWPASITCRWVRDGDAPVRGPAV